MLGGFTKYFDRLEMKTKTKEDRAVVQTALGSADLEVGLQSSQIFCIWAQGLSSYAHTHPLDHLTHPQDHLTQPLDHLTDHPILMRR